MTISVPQIVPDDGNQRGDDDIRQRMLELRDRQIQYAVSQAARTSPQRARQASSFGLPTGVPDDIFENVQAQQNMQRILDLAQQSPLTAKFFQNPDWAPAALDIPEEPGVLEKTWNSLKAGGFQIGAMLTGAEAGGLEWLKETLGPEFTPDFVEDLYNKYRADYQFAARRAEELTVRTGDWTDEIYGGLQSIPATVAAGVAGFVTKSPAFGLWLISLGTAGESYQGYRELGVEPKKALLSAVEEGLIEGATEKIAFTRLLGDIRLKSSLGRFFVNQITAEVPGEIIAGVSQDYVDLITDPRRQDETVGQWVSTLPETVMGSAIAAFTQGTIMSGGAKALTTVLGRDRNEQAKALTAAEKLQALNGAIENSVLREQAPDIYRQLNQEAGKITGVTLRVEASKLTDAVQQSIGMAAFAQAAPEAARQLAELGANPGTEIELTTAEYADLIGDAKKNEKHAQLRDALEQHIIVNENEMSLHDQQLAAQQVPAFLRVMEAAERAAAVTDDAVAADASVIESRILEAFGLEPAETEQALVIKPDVVLEQTEATEQAAEDVVSEAMQQEQPTEQPLQAQEAIAEQIPVEAEQSPQQAVEAIQQVLAEAVEPAPAPAPSAAQQFDAWFMGSRAATPSGTPLRLGQRSLKGAAEGQLAYSVMEGNEGGSTVSIRNPIVLTGKQAQAFVANAAYRNKVLDRAAKEGRDGVVAHTKKKGRKETVFAPLKTEQVRDYQRQPGQPEALFSRRLDSDQPYKPAATPEEAAAYKQYVEQGDTEAAATLVDRVANRVAKYVFKTYHGLSEGVLLDRRFDKSRLGEFTSAPSAKEGFFSAGMIETARAYAKAALKNGGVGQLIANHSLDKISSELLALHIQRLNKLTNERVNLALSTVSVVGEKIRSITSQYHDVPADKVFETFFSEYYGSLQNADFNAHSDSLEFIHDLAKIVFKNKSFKQKQASPTVLDSVIDPVKTSANDKHSELYKITTDNISIVNYEFVYSELSDIRAAYDPYLQSSASYMIYEIQSFWDHARMFMDFVPDSYWAKTSFSAEQHNKISDFLERVVNDLQKSASTMQDAIKLVSEEIRVEIENNSVIDYGRNIEPKYGILETYVFMNNPFFYDMKGKSYREESYYSIIKRAKAENHDGIVILNTYDGNPLNGPPDDVYVVFNPEQLKSRDPVLYETKKAGGGLIPLDERFNLHTDDVYYSRNLEAAAGTGTPPDQVRASARLASIMFANLAKTMKVSANELWERFGARIKTDPSLTEPGAYLPRDMLVLLSDKNATALDIMHELTHHYMHVLSVVGSDAESSQGVRDHWQRVLDILGVKDAAAWNALSAEEKAKHHETLADWFTLYIEENKAPSEKVRGVMASMARFFRGVYGDLVSKINKRYRDTWGEDLPGLTDDVRAVFDTMLASEATIRVTQAANAAMPTFQDFPSSNMTLEEWEEYQAKQELLRERAINGLTSRSLQAAKWAGREMQGLIGKIQRQLKRDRNEVRAVAEDKVRQEPVYQLLALLRQGKSWSDGKLQDAQQKVKLDADLVKQQVEQDPDKPGYIELSGLYGRGGLLGSKKKTAKFTGLLIDPKIVADTYGFDSVTAMMDALVNAQPIEQRIDAEVAALLGERNELFDPDTGLPDPVKIRQMAEQEFASAGYAEQLRMRLVAMETRALLQSTMPVRVMMQAARAAARKHLAGQKIGRINPGHHRRSATRASKYALEVLANGYDSMLARAERAVQSVKKQLAKAKTQQAQEAVGRAEARLEEVVAVVPEAKRGQPDNGRTTRLAANAKQSELAHEALARESEAAQKEVAKGKKYLDRAVARKESWNKGLGANFADLISNILGSFNIGDPNRATWSTADIISAVQQTGVMIEEEDVNTPLLRRVQQEAGANGFDIDSLTLEEFGELIQLIKMLEHVGREGQKMLRSKQKEDAEQVKQEVSDSVADNGPKKEASQRSATTWWGKRKDEFNQFLLSHTRLSQLAFIMDGGRMNGAVWKLFVDPAQEREAWRQQAQEEYAGKLDDILRPIAGALGRRFQTNVGKLAGLSEERQRQGQSETFTVEEVFVMLLNLGNQGNELRLLRGENWSREDVLNAISSVLTAEEIRAAQKIWNLFEELWPEIDRLERAVYGQSPVKEVHTPLVIKSSDGRDVALTGGYIPINYDPKASGTQSDREAKELAAGELGAINVSATTKRTFAKKRTDTGTGDPLHLQMSGVFRGFSDVIHDIAFREFLINTQRVFSRNGRVEQQIRRFYGQNTVKEIREWLSDIANANRERSATKSGFARFLRRNQSLAVLGYSVSSGTIQLTGIAMVPFRTGVRPFLYGVTKVLSRPALWAKALRDIEQLDPAMKSRFATFNREVADVANRFSGKPRGLDWLQVNSMIFINVLQGIVDAVAWHAGRAKAIQDGIVDYDQQIKVARQTVYDTQGDQSLVSRARKERGSDWMKLFTMFINYPITQLGMARGALAKRDSNILLRAGTVAGIYLLPTLLEIILKDIQRPDEEEKEDLAEYYAKKLLVTSAKAPLDAFVGVREFTGIIDSVFDNRYARQYSGPAATRFINDTYRLIDALQKDQPTTQRIQWVNMAGKLGLPFSAQLNRTWSAYEKMTEGQDLPWHALIFGTEK